jgi:hypothetical protein
MGLAQYLPSTATWKNERGEEWSIERLIREELAQDVRTAACGGTHRMMAFSVAVKKRRQQNQPMTGEFWRAEKFVSDYQKYALTLQNPSGSFSTQWFWRRSDSGDVDRQLETTGHIFEWLAFSLSDAQLRAPSAVRGASFLADLLMSQPDRDWSIGPLGHGLHGLVVFEERVFKQWQAPIPAATAVAGQK